MGDFCTDAYLLPLINQALDEAVHYLEGTCSPFIERVVPVPNVDAGTTSFTKQQSPDGALYGLMNPLEIRAKQAGAFPSNFYVIDRTDRMPDVNPPGLAPFSKAFWEWRSWIVYLTPLNYAADFEVRGEFRPSQLQKDGDIIPIHPMMTVGLAFATAALIGAERGNQGFITNYEPKAEATLDDIAAELVRQQQGTTSSVGRMSGRGGRRR
jgi:hypothetical protein